MTLSLVSSLLLTLLFAGYLFTIFLKAVPGPVFDNPEIPYVMILLLMGAVANFILCFVLPNFIVIRLRRIPSFLYYKNHQFHIDSIPVHPSSVSRIEKVLVGFGQGAVVYYKVFFHAMPEALRNKIKGSEFIVFVAPWVFLSLFIRHLGLKTRLQKAGFDDKLLEDL